MARPITSGRKSRWLMVVVLSLLSVFPPLATDMYLSAFDDIQAAFAAPAGSLELSLSVFFLGLCVGQLLLGPVIDRVGRRVPLLAGVAIFCIATVLLLLTNDIRAFIALRFVQAIGACAGMVVGRAVISDVFVGRQIAKMMTLLVMLMGLGPIVAPFLGSLLVTFINWQSVFVAMLLIGAISLALSWWVISETLPVDRRRKTPLSAAFREYWDLLRDRGYLMPSLAASFVQAAMFAYITASSSVFIGFYGLSNIEYGLCFGLVAVGLVVASRLNGILLETHAVETLVNRGLVVLVAAGIGLLAVSSTTHLWIMIIPLWFSIAAAGLLNANLMSLAMRASHGYYGSGSALLGALQFALAFLCSSIVGATLTGTAVPLALGVLIPGMIATVLWFVSPRGAAGEEA